MVTKLHTVVSKIVSAPPLYRGGGPDGQGLAPPKVWGFLCQQAHLTKLPQRPNYMFISYTCDADAAKLYLNQHHGLQHIDARLARHKAQSVVIGTRILLNRHCHRRRRHRFPNACPSNDVKSLDHGGKPHQGGLCGASKGRDV